MTESPTIRLGSALAVFACACFALAGIATADEISLRVLPETLWSPAARSMAGDQLADAVEVAARRGLEAALPRLSPEAAARGASLDSASGMRRDAEGLVHLGFRASRFEVQRTEFGQDKTVFSVFVTGTLFLVNLGTGEFLAARTFTSIAQSEKRGVAVLDAAESRHLAEAATADVVMVLVDQLVARIHLGTIEAPVVGTVGQNRVVLARGYLEGAYRGEGFSIPGHVGATARIESVQEHLSVAVLEPGTHLAAGSTLSRPGLIMRGGAAPLILVHSPDPDALVAPGVSGGELLSWVEDNLSSAGFWVVPSGTALIASQLAEAAHVDIAESVLVNAQAMPDVVAVPSVFNVLSFLEHDEETASDIHVLEVGLSLAFVGLQTRTVDCGAWKRASKTEVIQEGGRSADVQRAFRGLLKDAAIGAAEQAVTKYDLQRSVATLRNPPDASGHLSWKVGQLPLGLGTVAEVVRLGREYVDPRDGRSLGRIEEVVGTVVVEGSGSARESGRVMAAAVPVVPGMQLQAVSSTQAVGRRVVKLGTVDLDSGSTILTREVVERSVRAALHSSGVFRTSPDDLEPGLLASVRRELDGGGFSSEGARDADGREPAMATHILNLRLGLDAGSLSGSKKLSERVLTVNLAASLLDDVSGQPVRLVDPKGKEWTEYSMWQRRTLKAKERRGQIAVGLGDADAADQLDKLTFDAVLELLRRLGLMAGSSPPPP